MSHELPHIENDRVEGALAGLSDRELVRRHVFVQGRWVDPIDADPIEVTDCFTESRLGEAPGVGVEDVERAVEAARQAWPRWASTSRTERAGLLGRVRDRLSSKVDAIAAVWAREAGMPIGAGRASTAGLAFAVLDEMVEILSGAHVEERLGSTIVVEEPVGVVAAITPWNYPMSQLAVKTASALAAGCTLVAKPSEIAPFGAFLFADAVAEADLPPGVFNLVSGAGKPVGESLASDARIDAISFTGSTATGRRLMEIAAARIARITLELGGKSASVVLDESRLEEAVAATMVSCSRNNGQTCTSLTRLIVPVHLIDQAAAMAADIATAQRLGDPSDESTTIGPLVSAAQRDRVRRFIEIGIEEGSELVVGGAKAPPGLDSGFFVLPTVFSHVDPLSTIAQEEIFGPVLSVIGHTGTDHAIEIANGTRYGLAGAVWGNADEALAGARAMRAGFVSVNGGLFNSRAPYGGLGQSGLGRELGRWGMEEFFELRAVSLPA